MSRLNRYSIFAVFFTLSGCFSFNKNKSTNSNTVVKVEPKRVPILSSDIQQKVDAEDYASALAMAEAYLRDYPVAPQTQSVEFLRARSIEGLGRTEEAIDAYRRTVRTTATPKDLVARSLYRLSFCYEATNQDDKLVASLLDVLKRKNDLEVEIVTAEVPARIAAAYARLGNKKLADKYFSLADSGIRSLKTRSANVNAEKWLPKTLYFMGTMSVGSFVPEDFENSLRPLEKSQSFLLEAALINDTKWSPKAVEELKTIYTGIIGLIQKTNAADADEITGRVQQDLRWKMASGTLESLRKLKTASISPKEPAPPAVDEILSFINSKEVELTNILEEKPIGQGLTPEAERRKQNLRKARVVNPDPMLEEMAKGKK